MRLLMKDLVARTLARLIPSNYIENRISEWVSKQSGEGRWTTLLNTGSNISKLGSTSQQLEAYQSHVYKCVNLIKNRVQSLTWKLVYRQGNEEQDVDQHIFYDLALTPNQIWSIHEMIGFAIMHLDLTGRAFWHLGLNGLGKPIGFIPMLPSHFIDLKLASDSTRIESYKFYAYEQGVKKWTIRTYRSEEIIDFRYQHPVELLGGASPIQHMAYAYDTDLAIRVQQRNFFENSARPDLVFETEQRPNPDAIDRFLLKWNEAHQGGENKWQPAVLGGGMSAKVLNISNVDLELMNLMKFTKRDILEAYHVPEGKLGTVEDINRANQVGVDIQFNEECIRPRLKILEEVISNQILSIYDSKLYLVFENPVPKDKEARSKIRNENLKNQYSSINEERELDGKEPVSWGDAPWIPFNLIQIGQVGLRAPDDGGKFLKMEWQTGKGLDPGVFYARHGRKIDAQSKGIHGFFKRLFKDLRTEVNENLRRIWPRIEGVTNGLSVKKANKWIEDNKDLITEGNFDLGAAAKRIEDEGMIYIEQIIGNGNLKKSKIQITIKLSDLNLLNHIKEICKTIFNREFNINPIKIREGRKQIYVLIMDSKAIYNLLKEVFGIPPGKKSHIVCVPTYIKNSKDKIKLAFLKGIMATEGGKRRRGYGLSTASKQLWEDLIDLFNKIGIHVLKDKWTHKTYKKVYYGLSFRKEYMERLKWGCRSGQTGDV